MASTYSDLKIELIGTGEQVGTWGSTTNNNLGTALEEAIVGSADVSFSSSDVTLTLTNTNGTQSARHLRLNLTGTSGGARNLVLGSGCQIDKPYIIANGLADTVTVKNTTGTGVAVPSGKSMWVFNNGTNVVEVTTHVNATVTGNVTGNLTGNVTGNVTGTASSASTLATPRTIAISGGATGTATSFDGSANITIPVSALDVATATAGTLAVARGGTGLSSAGSAGNVLVSDGSVWASQPLGFSSTVTTYTSPATWTKPANLRGVKVTVVGGGGGGTGAGSTPSGSPLVSGAGAGGGTAIKWIAASSIPGPVSVTVGAAGAGGGTGSPQAGGSGGTSSFGAFCSATGGAGGSLGAPTSGPTQYITGVTISGGVGSGGDTNIAGGGGSCMTFIAGQSGGPSFLAGGIGIINGATGINAPANSYGAGAGAISQGTSASVLGGGSGGPGVVIVEEFYL